MFSMCNYNKIVPIWMNLCCKKSELSIVVFLSIPANAINGTTVDLMSVHRLRRWPNNETTLGERVVFLSPVAVRVALMRLWLEALIIYMYIILISSLIWDSPVLFTQLTDDILFYPRAMGACFAQYLPHSNHGPPSRTRCPKGPI